MRPPRGMNPWAVGRQWVRKGRVGLADSTLGARVLGTQLLLMLARLVLQMLITGSSMVGARAWVEWVKVRQLLLSMSGSALLFRIVLSDFGCICITFLQAALTTHIWLPVHM